MLDLLIPGGATGSSVLAVSCCRGFAWKEPGKESFDEAAAVPAPVQRELLLQSHLSRCWLNSDPAVPFLTPRFGSQCSSTPGCGLGG